MEAVKTVYVMRVQALDEEATSVLLRGYAGGGAIATATGWDPRVCGFQADEYSRVKNADNNGTKTVG